MPEQETGSFASGAPARQQSIRRHNMKVLADELLNAGPLPRSQLAARTGLTKATVSGLVESLIDTGIVVEHDAPRGSVGRPANPVSLNANGPVGLGIEVNVDYVAACAVDLSGGLRFRRVLACDNRAVTPRQTLREAARLVEQVWSDADSAGLLVAGLGIAVPGAVDGSGVLRNAPNLPAWGGLPVGTVLAEQLGTCSSVPRVDNEANLAALAERWFGAARTVPDFVYVSGEVGVGAGIVLDARLFRGVRGFAGELGHVLVDPAGPLCSCGSYGCLEQVAGREALVRSIGLAAASDAVSSDGAASSDDAVAALLNAAKSDDRQALAGLDNAGTALGIALSNLLNILDIPVVVLGGIYAELAPWLRAPITAQLRKRVVSRSWDDANLLASQLGADAAVRGAAGLAVRAILDDPASWAPRLR